MALAAGVVLDAGAAGSHALGVSAVVLSKNNCTFSTAGTSASLTIDPSAGGASLTLSVGYRCVGSDQTASWGVSDNGGQHYSGGPRMQNGANYLPYTLTYAPTGTAQKAATETMSVTVAVSATDAQSAAIGTYSDTIILTLTP